VIRVTRINSTPIVLNCDLIEQIQTVPDTMIALTNGKHLLVQESVEEIVERVIAFRRRILSNVRGGNFIDPSLDILD
jgi:flagellar protein FlbD